MDEHFGPPRDHVKDKAQATAKEIGEIRRVLAAQSGLAHDKASYGEIEKVLAARGRFVEERMAASGRWGTAFWASIAMPIGAVLTLVAQTVYHALFGGKGP